VPVDDPHLTRRLSARERGAETMIVPTGSLALRPRQEADAEALFTTMADPQVMRWWSRASFGSVEELRGYFAPDGGSGWRSWAIVPTPGEDRAVGFVSAGRRAATPDKPLDVSDLALRKAH
jgi:RimJ/RimL family protein N-acetyltransferase